MERSNRLVGKTKVGGSVVACEILIKFQALGRLPEHDTWKQGIRRKRSLVRTYPRNRISGQFRKQSLASLRLCRHLQGGSSQQCYEHLLHPQSSIFGKVTKKHSNSVALLANFNYSPTSRRQDIWLVSLQGIPEIQFTIPIRGVGIAGGKLFLNNDERLYYLPFD